MPLRLTAQIQRAAVLQEQGHQLSGMQNESEHLTCPSAAQDTTVWLELAGRMRAWKTFDLWPDEYLNSCLPAPRQACSATTGVVKLV